MAKWENIKRNAWRASFKGKIKDKILRKIQNCSIQEDSESRKFQDTLTQKSQEKQLKNPCLAISEWKSTYPSRLSDSQFPKCHIDSSISTKEDEGRSDRKLVRQCGDLEKNGVYQKNITTVFLTFLLRLQNHSLMLKSIVNILRFVDLEATPQRGFCLKRNAAKKKNHDCIRSQI